MNNVSTHHHASVTWCIMHVLTYCFTFQLNIYNPSLFDTLAHATSNTQLFHRLLPRCSYWKRHPSDDGLCTSDSFGFKAWFPDRRWKSLLLGWMIWMIWMEFLGRFSRWGPGENEGWRRSWDGKGTIVNGAVFLGTWHLLMSYFLRFVSFTWRQLGIRLHGDVQSFVCLFVWTIFTSESVVGRAMKESSKNGPNFM